MKVGTQEKRIPETIALPIESLDALEYIASGQVEILLS
jgi:hypothetical protein